MMAPLTGSYLLYVATLLSFAYATKNTKKLWITFLLILEKGFWESKYSFWLYALGTTNVLPGSVNRIKMHAWNHEYDQKWLGNSGHFSNFLLDHCRTTHFKSWVNPQ